MYLGAALTMSRKSCSTDTVIVHIWAVNYNKEYLTYCNGNYRSTIITSLVQVCISMEYHEFTPESLTEFAGVVFQLMAEKYGSECTLNELVVINKALAFFIAGEECNPTALHEQTKISKPTTTRATQRLSEKGYLLNKPHPLDGRRRLIEIGPATGARTGKDIDYLLEWLNSYIATGEMISAESR